MKKTIGVDIPAPSQACTDSNCPFHSTLTVHGRQFTGLVTSDRMHKTVTVNWERRKYVKKFERFEKRRSTVKAHNPPCINARRGDRVLIMETRPISKTKNFVVLQKLTAPAAPA